MFLLTIFGLIPPIKLNCSSLTEGSRASPYAFRLGVVDLIRLQIPEPFYTNFSHRLVLKMIKAYLGICQYSFEYYRMNWYKKSICVASSLSGEWWIIHGEAIFADGDIGDFNHEAYVINSIQSQYAYDEFNNMEYVDWDGFEQSLLKEKIQEKGLDVNDSHSYDSAKLIHEALIELGMSEEEIKVANGSHADAREYGVKHLGWKRVKGDNVETQTLTSEDLSSIFSGIYEIAEFSNLSFIEELTIDIEVRANNTIFRDVPYSVLRQRNISSLLPYRTKIFGGGFQLANTIKKKDIKASFLNKYIEAQKAQKKPYYVVSIVNDNDSIIESLSKKREWAYTSEQARYQFLDKYSFLKEQLQLGIEIEARVDKVLLQKAVENKKAEIARKQHREEQIPEMWWNKY